MFKVVPKVIVLIRFQGNHGVKVTHYGCVIMIVLSQPFSIVYKAASGVVMRMVDVLLHLLVIHYST
jgi:hypothetical protein